GQQDDHRGDPLPRAEEAAGRLPGAVAAVPQHGRAAGRRRAARDVPRHAARCLRRCGRRPADPLDGRPGPRDRPRCHVDGAPALVGRDAVRGRWLGLDRDRRRAGRVGAGRLAAPAGLRLAPARQRRHRDRPLPQLLQRADARDDGDGVPRGRRAHSLGRAGTSTAVRAGHRRRRPLRPAGAAAGPRPGRPARRPAAHQLGLPRAAPDAARDEHDLPAGQGHRL
ncbi:MAG: Gentisate 1,2-dioxygenase, partial [uncultured Friedmanniella sp.]